MKHRATIEALMEIIFGVMGIWTGINHIRALNAGRPALDREDKPQNANRNPSD